MLPEKTTKLFTSDNVTEALQIAAARLQARFAQGGETYDVNKIQEVICTWLELSVEQLADDALYHCVEGDSTYAFNRRAFTDAMKKIKPVSTHGQPTATIPMPIYPRSKSIWNIRNRWAGANSSTLRHSVQKSFSCWCPSASPHPAVAWESPALT